MWGKDMSNQEVLLTASKMCKSFGATVALDNVDLSIYKGEIRGLIGENGSGKSTISSIIAGMQPATSGSVTFKGEPHNPLNMTDALKKGIGMVVQEQGTISNISIAENIFLGNLDSFGKFGFVNRKKLNAAAKEALAKIGIDDINPGARTSTLDLQDRKLIEIAKVINENPEIFIVDETTTALSQRGRSLIYSLMEKLKSENKAVLFISHDLEELMNTCDTLTVLRDGKLIENLNKQDFDEEKIKQLMVGREMKGSYYRSDFDGTYADEVVLDVQNATSGNSLNNFSIQLHKGEILGIGGLSHCGMHTLGKVIFGFEPLKSGKVIHKKSGETISSPIKAMKQNIGYVSKDRDVEALSLQTSIKDNISIAGLNRIANRKIYISGKAEERYVQNQIETLNIKCASMNQFVQYLSGGNKQKVVFGKWIARNSEILILDCPTRGVDIGVKASMYDLIYKMKKEGKSIIIISEELPELIGMSDRLIIMKGGRQTAEFVRDESLDETKIIGHMI